MSTAAARPPSALRAVEVRAAIACIDSTVRQLDAAFPALELTLKEDEARQWAVHTSVPNRGACTLDLPRCAVYRIGSTQCLPALALDVLRNLPTWCRLVEERRRFHA